MPVASGSPETHGAVLVRVPYNQRMSPTSSIRVHPVWCFLSAVALLSGCSGERELAGSCATGVTEDGVKLCIDCQQERDGAQQARGGINRRGSKDSQLK